MITKSQIGRSMNYDQYIDLLQELYEQGKTTGDNSPEHFAFAKINLQRMSRLRKTIQLSEDLKSAVKKTGEDFSIVILTEGWCGDAAQNIPVFALMEEFHPGLSLHLLLRDENDELMNQYLTNGKRSIPKAICIEKKSMLQKFVWGPRPKQLQKQVEDLLKQNVSKEEKGLFVQNWYNTDRTTQLQKELTELIGNLR